MGRKNWKTEKIFSRLINNKTQKTFWDNITELSFRPVEIVSERAYKLANSKIDKEKIIGIYLLAQLGFHPEFNQKKTLDLYFKLLKIEKSPKVIAAILSSIGQNNEILKENQILQLIKFKNHNYSNVRFQLVLSLLEIENKIAVQTLIELSRDKHADVRNWATFGLGSQIQVNNNEITEALWNRINDKNLDTKLEAIVGFANRKDPRIKKIIQREIQANIHDTLLFNAILILNDKDFLPILNEKLKAAKLNNCAEDWVSELKECVKMIGK